jgi:hypothetical protein
MSNEKRIPNRSASFRFGDRIYSVFKQQRQRSDFFGHLVDTGFPSGKTDTI